MASNPLERAVIAAARAFVRNPLATSEQLADAVNALDAAGQPQEVGWHEVAAGDEIRSANNGRFYKVTGVIALKDGNRQITIDLAGSAKAIIRPSEKEPAAVIRRGQDGAVVDLFVNVFTSGAA